MSNKTPSIKNKMYKTVSSPKYIKFCTKFALAKASVNFLNDCVTNNVYPRRFWRILRRNRVHISECSLRRHALNERDTLLSQLQELEFNVTRVKGTLDMLNDNEREEFEAYVQRISHKQSVARQSKLQAELNNKNGPSLFPQNPERYVHNFSSVTLDKTLLEVLSLGPKFCIPSTKVRQLDMEVQFENLFAQLSDLQNQSSLDSERLKATLVNTCYQYSHSKPNMKNVLSKEHMESLKKLRTNKEIIISKPDKGCGIVLLDKNDYINKMGNILSDNTKFVKTTKDKDRTACIEKTISKLLCSMKRRNVIDTTTFQNIRPTGTHIPRLYGLPKIHKPGVPLRPVLDMVNSPYHALAKWLCKRLEPVRSVLSKYCVPDSFRLVDAIKDLNISDQTLFSLDVTSLFTNVPLKETIEFLCAYIQNNDIDIGIPIDDLKILLYKCIQNVQFQFDGELYRQIDGVAMGSPLGPLLADVFMAKLENDQLKPSIDRCTVYKRYVDDILCITDDKLDPMNMLNDFNAAHKCVKFTIELEKSNQLAFLDVCLSRRPDGTIQRTVHRKSNWTDQYIHFKSFVPMKHKVNLITCLADRAKKICSEDKLVAELAFLREIFLKNGYPEKLIQKKLQINQTKVQVSTAEKKNVYISLPFKGDTLALLTEKKLSSAVHQVYGAANLRVLFTSVPAIRLQHKDIVPGSAASFCVYSFTCSCGAGYIGRTTRRLSDRVREHHPVWINNTTKKTANSSILAHLLDTGHRVNVTEAFKPIYKVSGNFPRTTKFRILATAEAIAINRLNPPLCAQKQHVRTLQLAWPTMQQCDFT